MSLTKKQTENTGLSTRDKIIRTTSNLLENQGYHGTGIAQIIKESGAPKGSVYFHFPGGKEQIASEAVLYAGARTAARIHESLALTDGAPQAIKSFVEGIALYVEESGFQSGGPLLIVAAETATQSTVLNTSCRKAYSLIHAAFEDKLQEEGINPIIASALSTTIMAAVEGGIVLSRTYHSSAALRQIAKDMLFLVSLACKVRGG